MIRSMRVTTPIHAAAVAGVIAACVTSGLVAAVEPALAAVPAAAGSHVVNITLKAEGCPAKFSVGSGPATFIVKNTGAKDVSEFEVLDPDGIVVGETEFLTVGTTGTFVVALDPGAYTTYCPGGKRERGKLVVKGEPVPKLGPKSQEAVETYRAYLLTQAGSLVGSTNLFADAVKRGDVAGAKAAYAAARVPYERIEPIAETFGDLDARIDARKGDVPAARWAGFHKIEEALWVGNNTNNMGTVAQQLNDDTVRLADLLALVKLEPATIANGALNLLNEVSATKITGEEERYSRIDLVDFAANVEGSRAAFNAIRSLYQPLQPDTTAKIEQRFDAVEAALARYKRGDGYLPYDELTSADTKLLSQAIDALAEPLSTVGRALVDVRSS
jgi:iron uptake system component EfeO